jgi:pre-rRNA-processing protein IPI3
MIRLHRDVRAGTSLMTYRGGGGPTAHTLSTINDEFLVTANLTKPILHVWPINSSEQLHSVKLVLPGRATALAISPDGNFCVAGVQENIYIWQISSGNMLAVLQKHYQPVTVIKFIDDGSHFVTAGQDGMVLVWNLAQVYTIGYTMQQAQPLVSEIQESKLRL